MAEYTYRGDEGRVYPSLPAPANGPEVGSSYTLRRDPGDGRWVIATDEPKKPKHKPEPPTEQPTTDPAPAGETKE